MIYVLRTEFGIGAREAIEGMPLWERDLLLDEHKVAVDAANKERG